MAGGGVQVGGLERPGMYQQSPLRKNTTISTPTYGYDSSVQRSTPASASKYDVPPQPLPHVSYLDMATCALAMMFYAVPVMELRLLH